MTDKRPVLLCILDGWGLNPSNEANAVVSANTPVFDKLMSSCVNTTLRADGPYVGLPDGQFGNSEVGHMNIGAGRIILQNLPKISRAIEQNEIIDKKQMANFIADCQSKSGNVHLLGLCSDGGVHAHIDHIVGLAKILDTAGLKVHIHAITDGRDTAPKSGIDFTQYIESAIAPLQNCSVSTICGRYTAMDRDNRWERTQQAFDAIAHGKGRQFSTPQSLFDQAYEAGETDEFIIPSVHNSYSGIADGDGIVMANFRSDRARQILQALALPSFDNFDRGTYKADHPMLGMVSYSTELDSVIPLLFPPEEPKNVLGEVVSDSGLTQLRAAETEKYPHVTYFLNCGHEKPFEGEERIMAASPKVATYDLKPEMSANELTDRVIASMNLKGHHLTVINYANPDMVGHTGDFDAAVKAVETVDGCLSQLIEAYQKHNAIILITADHGNADQMIEYDSGRPHTAHTTHPVPFIISGVDRSLTELRKDGVLADIAPTILQFLGIEQPIEMSGQSLISNG